MQYIILSRGSLNTKGSVQVNNRGKADFQGQIAIDQLSVMDVLQKEPIVKWKKMSINSLNFSQQKSRLAIDTILLNAPYAKVVIAKDQQTNVGAISKSQPENNRDATTEEPRQKSKSDTKKQTSTENRHNDSVKKEEEFTVDITKIEIVDGSAFFADFSLTPNFASSIESLEGFIKDISSKPGTKATVDIKGKVDKYAPVSLKGEINPLIESPYLDLDFSLKSAELTSVNPYSGYVRGLLY